MHDRKKRDALPPIHDTARLWRSTELATALACKTYIRNRAQGWSLSWLRDAAPFILNRQLSEAALKQALNARVPQNARRSVWKAVVLLQRYAAAGQWTGIQLPPHMVALGRELVVTVRPVGMFYSPVRNEKRLLALQPRLNFSPGDEQMRIWMSALHYEYCIDPLEPLQVTLLDLSGDNRTRVRRLRELTVSRFPLLAKAELDDRLNLIANCFRSALDESTTEPKQPEARKETLQPDLFPENRDRPTKKPPT